MYQKELDLTIPFMMATIILCVLKVTGVVDWSWWLVLLPFYGPFAITLCIIIVSIPIIIMLGGKPRVRLHWNFTIGSKKD